MLMDMMLQMEIAGLASAQVLRDHLQHQLDSLLHAYTGMLEGSDVEGALGYVEQLRSLCRLSWERQNSGIGGPALSARELQHPLDVRQGGDISEETDFPQLPED
eukprot:3923765-Amphidinium_carterae.1